MLKSIIVACSANNVIGRDNDLPWRLPDDLKWFKKTTLGKPIVMGRKNYESIGKALPGRHNIVVTRDANYSAENCTIAHSINDALHIAQRTHEIMIIGGGEIYRQSLDIASRIYLTRVNAEIEGDVYFPDIDWSLWKQTFDEHHPADERHEYSFNFQVYDRIKV